MARTINSKVPKSSRSRPLHLYVRALEQKEYRLQRGPTNRSHICTNTKSAPAPSVTKPFTSQHTSLRNLGKRQTRAPLQIDILAIDQGAQRAQRLAREEVGLCPLCRIMSSASLPPVPSQMLDSHSPNSSTNRPPPPSPHPAAHSHSRLCPSARRRSNSTASSTDRPSSCTLTHTSQNVSVFRCRSVRRVHGPRAQQPWFLVGKAASYTRDSLLY